MTSPVHGRSASGVVLRTKSGWACVDQCHSLVLSPARNPSFVERGVETRARVHIQSGNIRNPDADPDVWIIDETVEGDSSNGNGNVGTCSLNTQP